MDKCLVKILTVATLAMSGMPSEGWAVDPPTTLQIDMAKRGTSVSPGLHGIFFEEINHAGDGGLYAELIQNRSFEDSNLPEGYVGKKGKLYPKKTPNHVTGLYSDRVFRWYRDSLPGWSLEGEGYDATFSLEAKVYVCSN